MPMKSDVSVIVSVTISDVPNPSQYVNVLRRAVDQNRFPPMFAHHMKGFSKHIVRVMEHEDNIRFLTMVSPEIFAAVMKNMGDVLVALSSLAIMANMMSDEQPTIRTSVMATDPLSDRLAMFSMLQKGDDVLNVGGQVSVRKPISRMLLLDKASETDHSKLEAPITEEPVPKILELLTAHIQQTRQTAH